MDDTVEERLTTIERSCDFLDQSIDRLKHSNKVILDAITDMKIKDNIDYIKAKQDLYTVLFVPEGMNDHDVITYIDKHFTSKRLANDRIKHLEKTSIRKNEGRYIYVLGSIDTRGDD